MRRCLFCGALYHISPQEKSAVRKSAARKCAEAPGGGGIYSFAAGFAALESQGGYLDGGGRADGCGERWSLRKVLRRFVWHDRIHAKAMYRMALRTFGEGVPNVFCFDVPPRPDERRGI